MANRKLPPDGEVVTMYRSGMSSGEIAEKCGVSPITVVSCLRRIGEPRRSVKEASDIKIQRGRGNAHKFWLGKKQPEESVELRVSKIRGENHYLWKGGGSKRDYRKVVKKDKCAQCGSAEFLEIHHKDFDHYNNSPGNLSVLCRSCHISLHKTAYWDAKRNGKPIPRSNGPVGWSGR